MVDVNIAAMIASAEAPMPSFHIEQSRILISWVPRVEILGNVQ
jgi:hypothetical protein